MNDVSVVTHTSFPSLHLDTSISEIIGALQYSTFHAITSDYDKSVILQVTELYSEYQNLCVTTDKVCKCKVKKQDCIMSPATELTTTSRELH